MFPRRAATAALVIASALLLSACSGSDSESAPTPTDSSSAAGFPRTIEVPAGAGAAASTVSLDAAPKTIAALDYESAEVVAELGLADRLVLVPEAVTNPALGGHVDEMEQVEHTIPVAMELDAETVLSLSPELVIMSPRHGAEGKIGGVLQQSGTQVLMLPDSWTSVDTMLANIDLIGQATGADEEADDLEAALDTGLEADGTGGSGSSASPTPRVLVLTNQAGRPFVTAGHAFPLELLSLAGGASVSDELGIDVTGPISAEQIVEADPDGILLIDMNGSGERLFAELLQNPAVASLPAAGQTLLVEGGHVQALGLTRTIDGLSQVRDWVQGLPNG